MSGFVKLMNLAGRLLARGIAFLRGRNLTIAKQKVSCLTLTIGLIGACSACGILSALVPDRETAERSGPTVVVELEDTEEPTRATRPSRPTDTAVPSATPLPSKTAVPTDTAEPTSTNTPRPTQTPRPTSTPRPPDAVVTSETLNMRVGPGSGYAVVTTLHQGDELSVTGVTEDRTWIRINVGGQIGWVYAAYCQVNRELGDGLVVSQPDPTAVPQPTSPPAPTSPPVQPTQAPAPGVVVISYIRFNGDINPNEPDEYAVITNQGGSAVDLAGWRLNADDDGQDFWFPGFMLEPGQSCRVYTNEHHPESCGFSFGREDALWANSGECGHLFDANSVEVSTYCY